MSNALDNAQLKRLARTILNNPSASARKAALLEIRKSEHPKVVSLLEQVIQNDKDAEVRDLANNLLSKRRIDDMLDSGPFDEPAETIDIDSSTTADYIPPPLPLDFAYETESTFDDLADLTYEAAADDRRWTCRFCDSENVGGHFCDSCGADRGDTEQTTASRSPQPKQFRLDEIFVLHKTNRNVVSEKKSASFTHSGTSMGCIMLFMIPFILAGVVVGFFAVKEWQEHQLLQREGISASGTFVSRRYDSDDDGTSYYATYRFHAGDTTYETEDGVNWEIYNKVEPGASMQVIYAPSNPSVSRIEGDNGMGDVIGITVFTVFWNLITWGVFLGMFVSYRRNKHLAREGQMVGGELLSASGRRDSDGDFQLKVEYSFVAPDTNEVVFKTESAQRNDLKNSDLPDKGTPVGVLYRNRNHFRML